MSLQGVDYEARCMRLEVEVERLRADGWVLREEVERLRARAKAALVRIRLSIDGKPRGDSGYMQSVIDDFVLSLRSVEEVLKGD